MKNKYFLMLISLLIFNNVKIFGQPNINNYTFSTGSNGSFIQDLNSNVIDMSNGTTTLIGANVNNGSGSGLVNLPFEYYFMGIKNTQFSVSSHGWLGIGVSLTSLNGWLTVGTNGNPRIAPFLARTTQTGTTPAMGTSYAGKIHYKVIGAAPTRTFVVEYLNMSVGSPLFSDTTDATFQARIYETTGTFEFLYGDMKVSRSNSIYTVIGFVNTTSTYQSINTATHTSSGNSTTYLNYTPGVISDLNSPVEGSRRYYRYSPIAAATPSALSFSNITPNSITLNWTDNASDELGYIIYRSSNGGASWWQAGTTAANATSFNATGLAGSTNYLWRVRALRESLSSQIQGAQATIAGSLSGIKTIGAGGDYTNLTSAFADINIKGLSGDITLQLIAGYPATPETYPIVTSNQVVTNATVTIYPVVTGLSITSANTTGTLNLNNATNIKIDGRVNGTGNTKDLIIENTSTSGYAMNFANDAINNTITYCNIKGSTNSITSGVIQFGSTSFEFGNDNNTISFNDIGNSVAGTPTNIIYSAGNTNSLILYNNANNILNNNIYNFYNPSNTTSGGAGVNLGNGNTGWVINNNSFYQTVSRTAFGAAAEVNPILINSTLGDGFMIKGNFIGGSAPGLTGAAYTLSGTTYIFRAIQIWVGTDSLSVVQDNIISNLSLTSSSTSAYIGLIYIRVGSVNVTGNTIGGLSSAGDIFYKLSAASSSVPVLSGILINSFGSVTNVINNKIGGLHLSNIGAAGIDFRGINLLDLVNAISTNIHDNVIGHSTTTSSINNSTPNSITGISVSSYSSPPVYLTNNLIANIMASSPGELGFMHGIRVMSGISIISNNTIRNLNSKSPTLGRATIIGIEISSTGSGQVITGNRIYSISNSVTTTSTNLYMIGLNMNTGTSTSHIIERNLIHSFSFAATSAGSYILGINAGGGTLRNNMIRLGIDSAGNSISKGYGIIGIDKATTVTTNILYNSIFIGGNNVSSFSNNTIAIKRSATPTTGVDSIMNNILVNNRSNNGSTGKHYLLGISSPSSLDVDYNLYYGQGTGFNLSYMVNPGNMDYTTLANWKTAYPQFNTNSIFADPLFVNAIGPDSSVNLHINTGSSAIGAALPLASVANDYDGETRKLVNPDIGADEKNAAPCITNTWTGNAGTAWENPSNWSCNSVPDINNDVIIPTGAVVVINSNVTIKTLLLQTGANLTVNSGFILIVLY